MTEGIPTKRKSATADEITAKKPRLDTAPNASSEGGNPSPGTPSVATDGTSKTTENEDSSTASTSTATENDQAKESKKETAPPAPAVSLKPVFGAASTFGSASIFEKMKNKTNVFEASPEKSPSRTQESTASATSSFGSFGGSFGAGSKFSNALQKASQKKSFLDEPKEETTEPATPSAQQYKQVELTEKKVETGEENEKSIYSATAKLFELDLSNISEGWKERGRGPIHVNQSNEDPSKARLVMRSNGLLRVILNYKITPTTALIKGLEASLSPGKFLRMTSVSAEGKPVQYMLKFSNEEIRNELFDKVDELKKEIGASSADSSKKNKQPQATGFRFIPDPFESSSEEKLQRTNTDVDPENQ